MSSAAWPCSPLDAAARAFSLLAQRPTRLCYDARGVQGLPDRVVTLEELQKLLLGRHTSESVRDLVWRELVMRARKSGPQWRVAVVGMAMPGLRRAAGQLACGWHGETQDLDAELLVGFLARLSTIDLAERRICGRLIDAGVRQARRLRDAFSDTHLVHGDQAASLVPIRPADHPDLVLTRAVATAVLDADEARLIAATRLEHATLARAAQALGISAQLASDWRARAEARLKQAIDDGDLMLVALRSRRTPNRDVSVRAVGSRLGSPARPAPVLGGQQQALVGKTSDR